MNYTLCLDPYSVNFDPSQLSGNGFNIYTDVDGFASPIATNIPTSAIFTAPLGNCGSPSSITLTNIPEGTTQILIVDNCITFPISGSTSGGSTPILNNTSDAKIVLKGANLPYSTDCCYALIDIPNDCKSFCSDCNIEFDTIEINSVGKIIAGELQSSCGTVTDYVIGWYRNGDYSSPALTTGFGSAFSYQFGPHPLTGNNAIPVFDGNYEGIIHDIIINGTQYSSVISGSGIGTPIPFESCFETLVINPLTCDNGTAPGKYSHQFNFNSQAIGTTPAPVSFTYALNPTTKYFAYAFAGFSIWDEIEIKWISGDPNATSNPLLYSQPIYLEKVRIGFDVASTINNPQLFESIYSLPGTYPSSNFDGQYSSVNNVWPKYNQQNGFAQRVLTLTTLETSSNPAVPDLIEITITPNPSNNNTRWDAGFQYLTDFSCTDCHFDNWPDSLPKIYKIKLQKQYGCDAQRLLMYRTSSCNGSTSDWMGNNIGNFGILGLSNPTINLINANSQHNPNGVYATAYAPYNQSYLPLKGNISCFQNSSNSTPGCGPSSTGTITFNQTPGQIQLTFNLESDYLHYKDAIFSQGGNLTTLTPCPAGTTSVDYYKYFIIKIPTQDTNVDCGDNSNQYKTYYHQNDYLNIQYVENPSSNFWSITIPQTSMVNCYPQNQFCDSCYNSIQSFVNSYNSLLLNTFSFTTNVGAKYQFPISSKYMVRTATGGVSGSYCNTYPNGIYDEVNYGEMQHYPWYSTHTIPFISSSNGWLNLPSLGAFIPCSDQTGSYPTPYNNGWLGLCYAGKITGYSVRFPHLTNTGFNYSLSTNDFEIYAEAGYGITGSSHSTKNVIPPPCPDPSSSLIYSYIGGVATVYTSSHFWQGNNPILIIDP